jgi:hypothetical protein
MMYFIRMSLGDHLPVFSKEFYIEAKNRDSAYFQARDEYDKWLKNGCVVKSDWAINCPYSPYHFIEEFN